MGSWYSVVGLAFDLVGFGIIAWDLYSDYGRFSLKRTQRRAIDLWDESIADGRIDPPNKQGEFPELDELRATLAKLTKHAAETNIYLAYLKLTGSRPGREPEPTVPEMAEAVRRAAQKPIPEAAARPPIRFAIALVLFGFALQIVGAWPTT